jgi:hypothetical protein
MSIHRGGEERWFSTERDGGWTARKKSEGEREEIWVWENK